MTLWTQNIHKMNMSCSDYVDAYHMYPLVLSTLGKISADNNMKYFSYRFWYFMQIVSIRDNLHEMFNTVS